MDVRRRLPKAVGWPSPGQSLTSGSNNIYLGAASPATESNTMRLGLNQTRTFIAGVAGSHLSGSQVVVSSSGQLGS
jgi:hypothetical protein